MFLFRSPFITVMVFLFALSVAVSASPQFGRPYLHAMNAVPDNSTTHNDATQTLSTQLAATSAAPQAAEVVDSPAGDNPGYMGDAVTNGVRPSRLANGGKIGIALGTSVLFVYSAL